MRHFLLAILFAVPTACASADELYDRCMDASDGSNPGFALCGGEWVARADAKLNKVWKELYSSIGETIKKDLLAEQRLWNAYKEQSCDIFRKGHWGREGDVIHFPVCRAEVIEVRIKQLETYFHPK